MAFSNCKIYKLHGLFIIRFFTLISIQTVFPFFHTDYCVKKFVLINKFYRKSINRNVGVLSEFGNLFLSAGDIVVGDFVMWG